MVKIKLLLIFLFAVSVFSAQYDIVNPVINETGNTIDLTFIGMDSSGAHDIGFGATDTVHRDTSGIKGKVGIERLGYGADGSRITFYDTALIIAVLSRNTPLEAYDSCDVYGSDSTTFTYAMNKSVYGEDVIGWVSIGSGLYTQGSPSAAFEAFTATNNSTEWYDSISVIGGQSYPVGQRLVYDSDFRFAVTAVHESARNRKTIQCVEFFAADEHSNTWDTLVTSPVIYSEDSLKITEYACNINLSGMTVGDTITVNWKIKPIYGDSLWTGDGVNTANATPYYSPKKFFYFNRTALVVDGATGNDAANESVALSAFNPLSPPAAFLTLGGAINYCRTLAGETNLRGRYKIFVRSGNYNLYGATITSGTFSSMAIEISGFPGERPNFNAASGSTEFPVNSWVKFANCTLSTASGNILANELGVILDSVVDNRSGGTLCYNTPLFYENATKHINDDFDMPYGAGVADAGVIIRNSEYRTVANSRIVAHMFIGNKMSGDFIFSDSLLANPVPHGTFIGFNYMSTSADIMPDFFGDSKLHTGFALVQNVIEKKTTVDPVMMLAADQSSEKSVNNVYIANNTVVGERMNGPYNDYNLNGVTDIAWRKHWTFKNNIFHRFSRGVTSFDAHGGTAGSPRYGNWMTIWGCNISGEIQCSRVATYFPRFFGLNSLNHNIAYSNDGSMNTFIKFVDDNSYCGGGAGFGDYHLTTGSPAINLSKDQVLAYDLDGELRGIDSGATGAYIFGTEYVEAGPTLRIDSLGTNHPSGSDSARIGIDSIFIKGDFSAYTSLDSFYIGTVKVTDFDFSTTKIGMLTPSGLVDGIYLDTCILTDGTTSDTAYSNGIYIYTPPPDSFTIADTTIVAAPGTGGVISITPYPTQEQDSVFTFTIDTTGYNLSRIDSIKVSTALGDSILTFGQLSLVATQDIDSLVFYIGKIPPCVKGYAFANLPAPTGDVDDFIFDIDLSLMPSEWWASCTDTSGMKIRCYKATGERLSIDIVFIDTSTHTGHLKGLWSDTLKSTGSYKVIVFPSDSSLTPTMDSYPYGRNSVYVNHVVYYPLDGNANERSGNGFTMAVSGAIDTVGTWGGAYKFDGINDYLQESGADTISASNFNSSFYIELLLNARQFNASTNSIVNKSASGTGANGFSLRHADDIFGMYINDTSTTNSALFANILYHTIVNIKDSITVSRITTYVDGLKVGVVQSSNPLSQITTTNGLTIGNRSTVKTDQAFEGIIDEVSIIKGECSAARASLSGLQSIDQSGFWGNWEWVPDQVGLNYHHNPHNTMVFGIPDTNYIDPPFYWPDSSILLSGPTGLTIEKLTGAISGTPLDNGSADTMRIQNWLNGSPSCTTVIPYSILQLEVADSSLLIACREKNIKLGSTITYSSFSDTFYDATTKWTSFANIMPTERGVYNFTYLDTAIAWGQRGKKVNINWLYFAGTLNFPAWFLEVDSLTQDTIYHEFVDTCIKRGGEYIHTWEINEITSTNVEGLTYKPTAYMELRCGINSAFGKPFWEQVAEWATEADPNVRLSLCDGRNDRIDSANYIKANNFYALVQEAKTNDVNIMATGYQCHLQIDSNYNVYDTTLVTQLNRVKAVDGDSIRLTEMDVRFKVPSDNTLRDVLLQGQVYGEYVKQFYLAGCRDITFWTPVDSLSWIPDSFPGYGAATPYIKVGDVFYKKPAVDSMVAIINSFSSSSRRRSNWSGWRWNWSW